MFLPGLSAWFISHDQRYWLCKSLQSQIWFSWLCNGPNKGVFCIMSKVLSANGSRHPDMHLYQGVDPRNCLKKAARDIFACICCVITHNEKWTITHFSSDASWCLTGLCWLLSVPGKTHRFPSLKALPLRSYITSRRPSLQGSPGSSPHEIQVGWNGAPVIFYTLAFQSGQWQYSKKAGKLQSSHTWCRSFDINLGEIIWIFNAAWFASDFAGNKSNIFKHVCSTLCYFDFCEGTKNIVISNKTNLTFETGFIMIHPPFPTKSDSGISQLTQSTIEETPPMNQDLGLHLNLKTNWIFGRSNHKRSHIEI